MIRRLAALAACFALLGAAPPAAAPAYARADAGVPLASIALIVRAGPDRETAGENGLAALVAQTIVRTSENGMPLEDAVWARGGALTYSLGVRYVRFAVEAPPDALVAIVPMLARALSNPTFDATTLASARAALDERIGEDEKNPYLAGLAAVRNAYYRGAGALPVLGSAASLAQIGPAQARAFYARTYLRGGAFLTEVGRVDARTSAAAATLVDALPAGTPAAVPALAAKPFAAEPRRIVLRRDVAQTYVVLGFAAPALGQHDFAAALVIRSLLGSVFDRETATTVPAYRRSIGAIYSYDVAPAQLALWINGARLDPSTGIGAVVTVLHNAATQPLAAPILERYKQRAAGEWQLDALSLDDRGALLGTAIMLGLDPSALDGVGPAIGRVTAADVQRVAKTWFAKYDVALILPRGGNGG